MKTYRAAIIGCGNIASLFDKEAKAGVAFSHAGAYQLCPKTELVAACDMDALKLRDFSQKWKIDCTYTDYQQMLKEQSVDILSICTPPSTHAQIVRDAAKMGVKAIYCEKPIALETVQARAMVKTCRDNRVLLMINHQRRFSPFWQEVQAKIDTGFFGEIQQVTCHYTRGIFNTGTHILDLFVFLFGPAEWAVGTFSKNSSPIPNDPNIDGVVKFKSGLTAHLQPCNDANFLIFEMDIVGAKGRLRVGKTVEYFKAVAAKNLLGKNELVLDKSPLKADNGPISLTLGVEHIIECLEKTNHPFSSGEHAVESLKIIRALMASAEKQKPVAIAAEKKMI